MKMMRIILSALAVSLCLCWSMGAAAQTEEETKLYTKTLRRPTVKALDKFLDAYPESVYAGTILRMRDSTLFAAIDCEDVTTVTEFLTAHPNSPLKREIVGIICRLNTSSFMPEDAQRISGTVYSAGWKMDNVDYVVGAEVQPDGTLLFSTYRSDGSKACSDRMIPRFEFGTAVSTRLVDSVHVTHIGYRNFLVFSYVNECDNGEQEYVLTLYDYKHDISLHAAFFGNDIRTGDRAGDYLIEGQFVENMSAGAMTAERAWIDRKIRENSSLVLISEGDLLTDRSVEWWLSNNPNAYSSAVKVSFGALDRACSLVSEYKAAEKVKGSKFDVALIDYRGYTSIVAYSKTTGDYLLVWSEPVCRNKDTDKLLNTVYFERGSSTLVMFYYEGKKTFKYRLNLADKSLRR